MKLIGNFWQHVDASIVNNGSEEVFGRLGYDGFGNARHHVKCLYRRHTWVRCVQLQLNIGGNSGQFVKPGCGADQVSTRSFEQRFSVRTCNGG